MSYTTESIAHISELKQQGLSWPKIVEEWNKKYSDEIGQKTFNALEKAYRVYKNTAPVQAAKKPKVEEQPHLFDEFTKEFLGDIVKKKKVKSGKYFITAATPTTKLSSFEFKEISEARYRYLLEYNKKKKKTSIEVKEEGGKFYEGIRHNVFKPGFKSILNYCEVKGAELVILPMRAHVKALEAQPNHYDPILEPYIKHFATEYTFNKYIKAMDAQLNPQQINPLTGLDRMKGKNNHFLGEYDSDGFLKNFMKSEENMSIIVAHTKQMYEPKATGNNTIPKIIYSTGCITKPEYLNNRIGKIALDDHEIGGLILEIKGNKFFVREVQVNPEDGSIIDLGERFYPSGKVERERAEFINIGDEHSGHHTPKIRKTLKDILKHLRPKKVGRNDLFDGTSVSHHLKGKYYTRYDLPECFHNLKNELKVAKEVAFDIFEVLESDCKVYMLNSNHHDFLDQYLDQARYIGDNRINYELAHRMVVMKLDGKLPLKEYLDPEGKMEWLDPYQDLYIEGFQVNAHGHMGPDGARGSNVNLEKVYGKVMKAHDHKVAKRYGLVSCGHFSANRHGYNKGPSTWLKGLGVLYKSGQVQTITVIDNEWHG